MPRQPSMLITPTLDECKAACVKAGMPEREGEKLFTHYALCGWRYGRAKTPISSLSLVVAGWKLRWEEKGCPDANGHKKPDPSNGAVLVAKRDELNRVMELMKKLVNGVDSHTVMRKQDRDEYSRLKVRRDQLRKELGVQY